MNHKSFTMWFIKLPCSPNWEKVINEISNCQPQESSSASSVKSKIGKRRPGGGKFNHAVIKREIVHVRDDTILTLMG